jgi:hypothetical protein
MSDLAARTGSRRVGADLPRRAFDSPPTPKASQRKKGPPAFTGGAKCRGQLGDRSRAVPIMRRRSCQ